MRIEVSEYDLEWPKQFQTIKHELELALHDVPHKSIEHVGSTAVPGLLAKPVIDIAIIVTEDELQPVIAAITKDGTYYYAGDQDIPDRYAIRPNDRTVLPKRNIYVVIDSCQSLRNHLAVRDTCRGNDEIRDKYGQLKRELSAQDWQDVDEYCRAKTQMLIWILSKSGFGKQELEQIAVLNGATLYNIRPWI